MEKISTGASTDSDLRIVTLDSKGEMLKPVADPEADDSVPKFRKPGPSKLAGSRKAPQFPMFENYNSAEHNQHSLL